MTLDTLYNAFFWYIIFACYIATGFGDPHMITLDGVEYTFNGFGEYQILQVAGPDFQLQGRMQPLINDDGSKSRATIYKAFAMKENGSDVVQVTIPSCAKIIQSGTKIYLS